jgi:hypothetical protein
MTEQARSIATPAIVALLTRYSFDSGELTVEQLADQWLQVYPAHWVHLALVEALYQGRYKAVSVTQILTFWQRRGQPLYRFDPEFEQLICNRLPKKLLTDRQPTDIPTSVKEEIHSHAKAQQARSNATTSRNSAKQDKMIQNPPTQAKANSSSLSLPKIVSDSLPKTTHPTVGRKDSQVPQSLDPTLLSNTGIRDLDEVLSSPPVQIKANQTQLTATNVSQTVWSELEKYPIHQFIPDTEASNFHTKLSAIAQRLGTRIALAERGDRSR